MDKNKFLNILNNCKNVGRKYVFSKEIIDSYLEKKNIFAKGYAIYEDNIDFKKSRNFRYCLVIELPCHKAKKKVLTSILMNPSNTFPEKEGTKARFDNTIRNLIVLADKMRFSEILVLNSFPVILGNGQNAIEHYKENRTSREYSLNTEFIENILGQKEFENILVACGDGVQNSLYNLYLDILRKNKENLKLWTYSRELTSGSRPRHLSTQSPKNRECFETFKKNPVLYGLKITGFGLEIMPEIREYPR